MRSLQRRGLFNLFLGGIVFFLFVAASIYAHLFKMNTDPVFIPSQPPSIGWLATLLDWQSPTSQPNAYAYGPSVGSENTLSNQDNIPTSRHLSNEDHASVPGKSSYYMRQEGWFQDSSESAPSVQIPMYTTDSSRPPTSTTWEDKDTRARLALDPRNPGSGAKTFHLLGTDDNRRDVWFCLIAGSKEYALPALLVIVLSLVIGTSMGVVQGYFPDLWVNRVTGFFTSVLDSLPRFFLLLVVSVASGFQIVPIMVALGILNAPRVAHIVRARVVSLKESSFIEAAKEMGLSDWKIIMKHILWYNCRSILLVEVTYAFALVILIETSLDYLGLGIQPAEAVTWGNMLSNARDYLWQGYLWFTVTPAIAIVVTIVGIQLLGDGLARWFEIKELEVI